MIRLSRSETSCPRDARVRPSVTARPSLWRPGGACVGRDASTRAAAIRTRGPPLNRPVGHPANRPVRAPVRRHQPRSSSSSAGASAATDASVIGSTHELDVADPLAGVRPELLGELLRRALERHDGHPLGRVAHDPARAAGHPDLDGDGALDLAGIAAGRTGRLVHDVTQRRHAAPASCPCPRTRRSRRRRGGCVAASIRGPTGSDQDRRAAGARGPRQQLGVAGA